MTNSRANASNNLPKTPPSGPSKNVPTTAANIVKSTEKKIFLEYSSWKSIKGNDGETYESAEPEMFEVGA